MKYTYVNYTRIVCMLLVFTHASTLSWFPVTVDHNTERIEKILRELADHISKQLTQTREQTRELVNEANHTIKNASEDFSTATRDFNTTVEQTSNEFSQATQDIKETFDEAGEHLDYVAETHKNVFEIYIPSAMRASIGVSIACAGVAVLYNTVTSITVPAESKKTTKNGIIGGITIGIGALACGWYLINAEQSRISRTTSS